MGLPRTFVGFSGTDLWAWEVMRLWKDADHVPIDFCNCQLEKEIRSEDEDYIKSVCRQRLRSSTLF